MREYQYWALHEDGQVAFAGIRKLRVCSASVARNMVRRWLKWAREYVATNPGDYPLADSVRQLPVNPVVQIRLHPCGERHKCQSFDV